MALDVHRHPPRAEQGLLRLALMAAPQDGVHTGQQLPVGVRLGDVVVRTDLQTHDLVDLKILSDKHDNCLSAGVSATKAAPTETTIKPSTAVAANKDEL